MFIFGRTLIRGLDRDDPELVGLVPLLDDQAPDGLGLQGRQRLVYG